MALDGEKRQVGCIALERRPGAVGRDRRPAERAAPRRRADAGARLFSGWGVRTYAAGQPGYNPLGYHTGSVWPHDNALIVAGIKRYGFDRRARTLAGRIFEAAQRFPDLRLPELYCGFDRRDVGRAGPLPRRLLPAGLVRGGVAAPRPDDVRARADAAGRSLELVRPHLPTWLGKLTVTNLRVGDASVDLLFHRWRGTTSAEVLRKSGDLEVTIRV